LLFLLLSTGRCRSRKALFPHVFNKAWEWSYTSAQNPCQGVNGYRATGRSRYITDEEFEKVRAVAHFTVSGAMEPSLLSGQLPANVLKLNRTDIHDDALWVIQNKKANWQLVLTAV
jgi:hypothetical protein